MIRTLTKACAPKASLVRLASTATPSATTATTTASTPISTPTLRKLDKRWDSMTEEDRADVINSLAERQKADWRELTPLEKQAAWFVSYGEWGPRRPVHAKGDAQRIFVGVFVGVAAGIISFFGLRAILPAQPKTMSQEWQQATTDELESINAEPFTGANMVQSGPTGISAADSEEEDDE